MATLSATLQVYDRFSGPLKDYAKSMETASKSASGLKSSMNMPTGGFSGATREVQNLGNQAEKTGGIFKKMLGAQVIGGVIVSGISKVTSSFGGLISGAIDASDAMTKFQSTMEFAGQDNKAIETAKKGMKQYADETVYDTNTIANTTAQLAANGVDDYLGLTKAAGNLNAVAGGNADTFKSVAMMMTQTVGATKLTTENWNQMTDAIPGASGKMQEALKAMGAYAGNDFRKAMADGEISADEFNNAIMQLGMTDAAVEAAKSTATFEGAMGQLEAAGENAFLGIINAIGMSNITGAINGIASAVEAAAPSIAAATTEIMNALKQAVDYVSANSDWLGPLVGSIAGLATSVVVINKVAGGVKAMGTAFGALKSVGGFIGGMVGKLFGVASGQTAVAATSAPMAAGETAVGSAAGRSAGQTLAFGAAVLMIGAGIVLAAVGMYIFVQAALQLASGGMAAVGALVALTAVIALFAVGMAFLGPVLTASAIGVLAFGAAILMIGIGIAIAAAGIALLATQLPIIAQYGVQAAGGFLALGGALIVFGAGALIAGVGLAILGVGLVVLGAGALVAAAGVLLLGVATMVFGAGLLIAGAAIMIVAMGLTMMAAVVPALAAGFMMLVAPMAMLMVTAPLLAVGLIALGAALLIAAVGGIAAGAAMVIFGAGAVVAGAGLMILGAGIAAVGIALTVLAAGVMALYTTISQIFSDIVQAVSTAIDNVVTTVGNGIQDAISAVTNIGSAMVDAGKDFVMGFVNGITGAISGAVDAAKNMAKSVVDGAKGLLGIHSPSRVMRDQVGKYVAEGMAVGITKNTSVVAGASEGMAQSAISAANGFTADGIGGSVSGVGVSGVSSVPSSGLPGSGVTNSNNQSTQSNNAVNLNFDKGSVVIQSEAGESGDSLLAKLESAMRAKYEAGLGFS